ncbi:MAG: DMT family transporter [Bacteroidales bacterium]|nr:DMT family transporter [Bacteroidales bacterium]
MRNNTLLYSSLLMVTAALWGFSFVAQRAGMNYVGPFTFNGVRFMLGVISLLPLYFFRRKHIKKEAKEIDSKKILKNGLFLGVVLFIAASLQQIGMQYTTAANGGFITSLYVVLVPFFLFFLKEKISVLVWIGAAFALIGLYLLSFTNGMYLAWGDMLVLFSAVFWAAHVILIGKYANLGSVILLSIIQFSTTAVLSLVIAFIYETPQLHLILKAYIPILYGGVVSVGIAYTLQMLAQKKVPSDQSAIILSFESAFAMLGGWLLLDEEVGWRSLIGASFMLGGVVLSQIKLKKKI